MGGGGVPGPESGDQDEAASGNIGQSGADEPGPVAASDGVQQNIVVTGWPRNIRWSEFEEIQSRPQNTNEDAQVAPQTRPGQAQTVRSGGQWMLAELELEIVVDRNDSWVVTSRKSGDLRDHEQGHYDIHGLIVGRELAEQLRDLRARSSARLAARLRRVMRRAQQKAQRLTLEYDRDTRHGLQAPRQAAWEAQIRNAIDNNVRLRAPS